MQVSWAENLGVLASDRGLAYGDGLFETIRVNGERPAMPGAHLDRLCQGANRLGFELDRQILEKQLDRACHHYGEKRGAGWVLKMLATRGSGGRGYTPPESPSPQLLFSRHALPPMPDSTGVAVSRWPHPLVVDPLLAGMKTLNRLPQVLASQAIGAGCYEILLADGNGCFLEGSRTNLLALDGDRWLTPPATGLAVAGIARQAALEHLRKSRATIREEPIDPAIMDSPQFGGLLLVNSVMGAVPVRRIENWQLPISDRLATIQSFLFNVVNN